jgi:hypothetical protein
MNPAALSPLRRPALALAAALAAAFAPAARADGGAAADADKRAALQDFATVYDVVDTWQGMAPKIARDSLPRLEDAVHADIDADALPAAAREAAHHRVPPLLAQGRDELAAALRSYDAAELGGYARDAVYGKYFDTDDIRGMAAFYGSGVGRKLSALTPALIAESRRPGAKDVLARHFSEDELREIVAFWDSPAGRKMSANAEQVREDLHEHFVRTSEPALQAVARRLATRAEDAAADR